MREDFIPTDDQDLNAWMLNFKTVALVNQGVLELTPGEIQELNENPAAFASSLTAVETAKQVYRAKVGAKNGARGTTVSMARRLARKFKANSEVSEELLLQLGVVSNSTRGPVVPVTGLTVDGCSDGVNKLKWNRAANAQGTMFIIESSFNGTDWDFVGVVTKVTFNHGEQPVGETQWYRVTANRAGQSSAPCPAVAVYGPAGGGEIRVAA